MSSLVYPSSWGYSEFTEKQGKVLHQLIFPFKERKLLPYCLKQQSLGTACKRLAATLTVNDTRYLLSSSQLPCALAQCSAARLLLPPSAWCLSWHELLLVTQCSLHIQTTREESICLNCRTSKRCFVNSVKTSSSKLLL